MLAGKAVIAIWNGIREEARAAFYKWHDREHIPERVAIPGFLRGRRYAAADEITAPEFFTLYEVAEFAVIKGQDYAERLSHPTDETRRVTAYFRDTERALAHVVESHGPGAGGALATARFAATEPAIRSLRGFLLHGVRAPGITGSHLCVTDQSASGVRSAESAGRRDITDPPGAFVLLEAIDTEALAPLAASLAARCSEANAPARFGVYRLQYLREDAWTHRDAQWCRAQGLAEPVRPNG